MSETKVSLGEKTVAELREICKSRDITGMSRKRKDVIISAILADNRKKASPSKAKKASTSQKKTSGVGHTERLAQEAAAEPPTPVTAAQFHMSSVLTKPSAKRGDKTTTAIKVSCGAASGEFPVVGKPVGAVGEFLREVLNVDRLADGMVNGEKVESSYVLQEGDVLEFIKPAGRKG